VARRDEDPSTAPQIVRPSSDKAAHEAVVAKPRGKDLGRYELLFEIARGGMATVHAARLRGAHGFERLVAVKLLHAALDAQVRSSFLAEARLSARLLHPNVVQTLELGEDSGTPFIVMELVVGVSARELYQRAADTGKRLDPWLSAHVIAQAAAGLHVAHELKDGSGRPLGLVHRDVSPHNILVSFEGRVCVADFGIAKLASSDHATESGVVKGKFGYMSPEQARAEPLDRRSDVFSLGIVLHEALTGRRLFWGSSPSETLLRIIGDPVPDPRQSCDDVPAPLADVCLRCLRKDPAERYATAREVADALRDAIRASGRHLDEREVARAVEDLCSDKRRDLEERIERAVGAQGPAGEPPVAATTAALDERSTQMATLRDARRPRRTRGVVTAALAVLGAAGVAASLWAVSDRGQTLGSAPRASDSSTAAGPSLAALPATSAEPTASAPPSVESARGEASATAAGPSAPAATSAALVPPLRRPTARTATPAATAVGSRPSILR
jgi:serine/threonine-protein kinase